MTARRRAPKGFALAADLSVSAIDASKIEAATFPHPIAQISTIAHSPSHFKVARCFAKLAIFNLIRQAFALIALTMFATAGLACGAPSNPLPPRERRWHQDLLSRSGQSEGASDSAAPWVSELIAHVPHLMPLVADRYHHARSMLSEVLMQTSFRKSLIVSALALGAAVFGSTAFTGSLEARCDGAR